MVTNITFSLCPKLESTKIIRVVDLRLPEEYLSKDWKARNKDNCVPFDYGLLKIEESIPLDKYFTLVNKFSNEMAKISIFGYP